MVAWQLPSGPSDDGTFFDARVLANIPPPIPTCFPAQTAAIAWLLDNYCATDLCDGSVPVSLDRIDATNPCKTVIGLKASDQCGNTAYVTNTFRIDSQGPSLTCPPARSVECGLPWTFDTPTATDNCDSSTVTIQVVNTVTNALCGWTFSATRTWKALDSCGNSATCSQTITMVDTKPPYFPAWTQFETNRTIECDNYWQPNSLDFDDDYISQVIYDDCDPDIRFNPGAIQVISTVTNQICGNTFSATRIWHVTDSCGNIGSFSQTIKAVDTKPPFFSTSCKEVEVLAYQATNARYHTGIDPSGYYTHWNFDDSAWAIGQGAFGGLLPAGCPLQSSVHTAWPASDPGLIVRRIVNLPVGASRVRVKVTLADAGMNVFFNEIPLIGSPPHLITISAPEGCPTLDTFTIAVPQALVQAGPIELRVRPHCGSQQESPL